MLGNVFETPQKDGKFTSNIFAEGIVAKLPQVVVSEVVSFVQQVFDDNGIAPSKHLKNRTVKGTVETIIKALGVLTWDVASNPIRGANGDASMMHAHAEWTRNLVSMVDTKAMFRLEKAEAQGKSKVGVKALVDKWEKPSQNSQISQQAFALVEARDRDRAELYARLEAAAASNNQQVVLQTATGATAKLGDKYLQARLLEYGPAQASTLGLVNFMGVDQASFFVRYSAGVDEMLREVKDRSQVEEKRADIENDRRDIENLVAKGALAYVVQSKQNEIDEKTKETDELEEMLVKAEKVFLHILNDEAGGCNETFQNGWKMDCDPDTGEVLPERLVDDSTGGKRGMRALDLAYRAWRKIQIMTAICRLICIAA
jgi:hypothetical protein